MLFFVSLFFTPAVFEMTVRLNPIENMIPVIVYSAFAALSSIRKPGNNKDNTTVNAVQNKYIYTDFMYL